MGKNNNTSTPQYTESEVLQYILHNVNISIEDVARNMKKSEIRKILEQHPYAISQHKDGRWRTYIKKDGKRHLLAKSSKEQLEEALFEHYKSLETKLDANIITLEALFPTWKEYKQLHGISSTYMKRIESDWYNHYADTDIVKTPLSKLNKMNLDIWAHELIQKVNGRKKQYYNISMIMRQMLDWAVNTELIQSNPLKQVNINAKMMFTPVKKKASETQVFSRQEVKALYATAWADFESGHNTVHKLAPLAIMFQFQSGVRIGELAVLRYEDIIDSEIYVQRMYRYEQKEIVEYTKGHTDGRYVTLTPTALKLIQTAKEYQQKHGLNDAGYIFSVNDEPLSYYAIRKLYYRYCKEIGTCTKSSHKSRKTYISSLIDGGVNINEIRQLVGHADERTTYNSYCYDRKTKSERVELITQALS